MSLVIHPSLKIFSKSARPIKAKFMWSHHRLCNLIKMAAKLFHGKNKKVFEYLICDMSFKIAFYRFKKYFLFFSSCLFYRSFQNSYKVSRSQTQETLQEIGMVFHMSRTCLLGFRPGPTQTRLYSHRRWFEA